MSTLARVRHERATANELGDLLEQLEGTELEGIDADIVRIARRDWERARLVPDELAAELASASAEGQDCWQAARANDDFAAFAPALERNVRLAREYGSRVAAPGESTYDALLADYDFGLRAHELRELFDALARRAAAAACRRRRSASRDRKLDVPVAAQRAAVTGTLARLGVRPRGLARGRLGAPVHGVDRQRRHARHDALQRRQRGVAAELAARVRPRAVRAPGRSRAGAHEPRSGNIDVDARVPEQAVGEPRGA